MLRKTLRRLARESVVEHQLVIIHLAERKWLHEVATERVSIVSQNIKGAPVAEAGSGFAEGMLRRPLSSALLQSVCAKIPASEALRCAPTLTFVEM